MDSSAGAEGISFPAFRGILGDSRVLTDFLPPGNFFSAVYFYFFEKKYESEGGTARKVEKETPCFLGPKDAGKERLSSPYRVSHPYFTESSNPPKNTKNTLHQNTTHTRIRTPDDGHMREIGHDRYERPRQHGLSSTLDYVR
jgi:hypothetical protein